MKRERQREKKKDGKHINSGAVIRADVRLTPARTLVVQLKLACPRDDVDGLFLNDFAYSLDIERLNRPTKTRIDKFVVRENNSEAVIWSCDNPKQVLEMLASIYENGFFTEELIIRSGDREYSRTSDQKVSQPIRNKFRRIIEGTLD